MGEWVGGCGGSVWGACVLVGMHSGSRRETSRRSGHGDGPYSEVDSPWRYLLYIAVLCTRHIKVTVCRI